MHPSGIDMSEAGPPPVRRAVLGLLLGAAAGALAAALLPRDRRFAALDNDLALSLREEVGAAEAGRP